MNIEESKPGVSAAEVEQCVTILEKLLSDAASFEELSEEQRRAVMGAAGRLSRPARDEIRVRNKLIDRARRQRIQRTDKTARAASGIRQARLQAVFQAPLPLLGSEQESERVLLTPRSCYVCKKDFVKLHHFYDSMCPKCADFNYRKRFQSAPLDGQVALITGARLKIGYQAALMMLRAGAKVIVTTRFPVNAAARFANEQDFALWQDRLEVHGLDLRHTPSVELFARFIELNNSRLDILINNAAQTVRRPPGFYNHLLAGERSTFSDLSHDQRRLLQQHGECRRQLEALCNGQDSTGNLPLAWQGSAPGLGVGIRASAELSQVPYNHDVSLSPAEVFPAGQLDVDLQQVDLRKMNSWRLTLGEVPTPELLEVQLINAIAPFVLIKGLLPLLRKNPTGQKHIVNVTAVEGQFYRFTKSDRHPHTNMAKAALNMMTHTSAYDLIKDGIHMNAVDTGWVTDEDPVVLAQAKQDNHDFQPPLDIVDGAARVCDPIFDGALTGKHRHGQFLKDYFPAEW